MFGILAVFPLSHHRLYSDRELTNYKPAYYVLVYLVTSMLGLC